MPAGSLKGHTSNISSLSWTTPNLLISSSHDDTARFWDTRAGKQVGSISHVPAPFQKTPKQQNVKRPLYSVASNGLYVATGTMKEIQIWDLRTQSHLSRLPDNHKTEVTKLLFHPTENHLYSGSEEGVICLFDFQNSVDDESFVEGLQMARAISNFGFFGPKAEYFWSTSTTNELTLWNLGSTDGGVIAKFPSTVLQALSQASSTEVFNIITCSYSAIYQKFLLFAGTREGAVVVFDILENRINYLFKLEGSHNELVRSFLWLDDLNMFITGGENSILACWKAPS